MLGRGKQPERRRPLTKQANRAPVVQYYRGQSTQPREQTGRQTRQAEQRRPGRVATHLKRLPAYVSIVVIAGSLVYCSILGNKVTVVLPAESLHTVDFYDTQAGNAFNNSLFNHSKLTLNVRSLKRTIMQTIPEAADVTVSIPLVGRKPVIGISLVPARFLLTLPNGKAYVLGENGVVLADAASVKPSARAKLQALQEDVPLAITTGKAAMSASDVRFIDTVTEELQKARMPIDFLQLPVGASELYVHLKDKPYMIKFAFNGDPRQQVGAYLAVMAHTSNVQPQSYVDVRIGERVFVK